MSRRRKVHADGTPVPRRGHVPRPEPGEDELSALDALTDTLPEPLRAFRDLCLLGAGRRARIEAAIAHRTRSLTLLLHEIHDPHNQAAILRTSEALGVVEVHRVETETAPFRPSTRVTQAAHRWLEVHHHPNFEAAVSALRARGLTVLALALGEGARPLHEVDLLAPTAFVLGNEARGLPADAIARCDAMVQVPIYGLSQSFNVSVTAAIVLARAIEARRAAFGSPGDLSEDERMLLRLRYYRTAAGRAMPPSLARALARLESSLSARVEAGRDRRGPSAPAPSCHEDHS